MAKTDYRLVIEAARGEMKRANLDAIEILTFEYATDSPRDASTGQAIGRRRYSGVTFTKLLDSSSPILQQLLANNTELSTVKLTCTKAGTDPPLEFYEVTWSGAMIYHYKIRGELLPDEYGPMPRDEFSITFAKVEVDYKRQSSKGNNAGNTNFVDDLRSGR